MRTLILTAVAALVAAACTPMTGADPASPLPGQSTDAASCAARGGEIRRVGRMQSEQCIILYADAGKSCTDGDQCLGDCRVEGNTGLAAGTPATGQCTADSDRFGCHTRVEDGKADNTLCID